MAFVFGEATTSGLPMYYFQLVYVIGFIAAIGIGSLAWYNSKRPPGWEDSARPDFVPDMEAKEESSKSEEKA
ncbi:MAG: hypothetical protein F6K11_14270 [Leptolyngbya sp. SIO3F4]|nr:hypothetical protein [Leptolyngbya sp. SIO3F4]